MLPNRATRPQQRQAGQAAAAPAFSLVRMLTATLEGKDLNGYEREVIDEANKDQGTGGQFCSSSSVPWEVLLPSARALTAANPTGGATLIGSAASAAVDALRPYSVAVRAGFNVQAGLKANLPVPTFPIDSDEQLGTWLTMETASINKHTPATGLAMLNPHSWGDITDYSVLLLRQNPAAESMLRAHMLRTAGQAVDRAVLGWGSTYSETEGRPVGLIELPDIQTYSASTVTELMQTTIWQAPEYVALKTGSDAAGAWISGPYMRRLLQSGNGALPNVWGNEDKIGARPAHCTGAMASNCIAYGDWSTATLGLFGSGIEIELDPFTNFKKLSISMRVIVTMDVAFSDRSAVALVLKD